MWEAIADFKDEFSPLVWNAMIVAGALIVGFIIKAIVHWIFLFYTKRSDYYLFKAVTKFLQAPANVLIPLLTLNAVLPLTDIGDYPAIRKTIELALIGAFAFLLIRIIKVFEDLIYNRNDVTVADNLKARKIRTQIRFISRMVTVIVVVLAVAAMLLSFESLRKVGTGLLAGVGVSSIIIGFAAQSTLSNVLAGFQIAFTQPIRIDDVVVVEGEWGRIEDINLTYVVVKIWDERRLVLPINYFITKPFQNWTRVSSDLLGTVFIYVDYSIPVDDVRKKFFELLQETKWWDGNVKALQVTDLKERTLELRALMSARNSSDAFDLRCYIREKLISFIKSEYPDSLPKTRMESAPIFATLEQPSVQNPR